MASRRPVVSQAKGATTAFPSKVDRSHLYRFRETPEQILKILAIFNSIAADLRARRRRAWMITLGYGICTGLVITWTGNDQQGYSNLVAAAMVGILAYLISYLSLKLVSSSRSVNPNRTGNGVGPFFELFLFLAISVGALISQLDPLSTFRAFPPLFIDPWNASLMLITGTLAAVTIAQLATARRYRSVVPERFELLFLNSILDQLLREIPADQPCTILFNPFPAIWSVTQGAAVRGGKVPIDDCLLKLSLPLGSGRSLALTVLHRTTQKGQRKFKGYKHKVKISYYLADPNLKSVNTRLIKSRIIEARDALPVAEIAKVNQVGFRSTPYPEADLRCHRTADQLSVSEQYLTVKSTSSRLAAVDLPHPLLILKNIQTITTLALS